MTRQPEQRLQELTPRIQDARPACISTTEYRAKYATRFDAIPTHVFSDLQYSSKTRRNDHTGETVRMSCLPAAGDRVMAASTNVAKTKELIFAVGLEPAVQQLLIQRAPHTFLLYIRRSRPNLCVTTHRAA